MEEQTIALEGKNSIVLKAHGDLSLSGWAQAEARLLVNNSHNVRISQEGDSLQITCLEDCDLTVPEGISVRIDKVGGDAFICGIKARLQIQKIGGDLSIEGIENVEIGQVGGDCLIYESQGHLSGQRFGGDVEGLQINGPFSFEHIGGDAKVQVNSGAVTLRAGGDIVLQVDRLDAPLILRAGGDCQVHLPEDASATLELESGGDQIEINVGGKIEEVEKWAYGATLGGGEIPVKVDAGGDVLITDNAWAQDDVQNRVEDLHNHWKELDEERENPPSRFRHWPDIEAITRRAARHGEKAAKRAEERLEFVMRQMGGVPPIPPFPPFGPKGTKIKAEPIRPKVSPEERMLILQMLQEKKISVEEAERLLQALEN